MFAQKSHSRAIVSHNSRPRLVTPATTYCADDAIANLRNLLNTLQESEVHQLYEQLVLQYYPELGSHLAEVPWHSRPVDVCMTPKLMSVEVFPVSAVVPEKSERFLLSDSLIPEEEVRERCQVEQSESLSFQALRRFEAGHRSVCGSLSIVL